MLSSSAIFYSMISLFSWSLRVLFSHVHFSEARALFDRQRIFHRFLIVLHDPFVKCSEEKLTADLVFFLLLNGDYNCEYFSS